MIRDVDLVSYLPPFLTESKETAVTLEAENPEFRLVWEGTDRVLKNEFIATADEYGISRFEKLLHIFPSSEDTLEIRRSRVQIRWMNVIPYVLRVFFEQLISICGETNFKLHTQFVDYYLVELEVSIKLHEQLEEIERLVATMFPCNIVIKIKNHISNDVPWTIYTGGAVVQPRVQRFNPIPTAKFNTFHDIRKKYTDFGKMCKISYAELLLYD